MTAQQYYEKYGDGVRGAGYNSRYEDDTLGMDDFMSADSFGAEVEPITSMGTDMGSSGSIWDMMGSNSMKNSIGLGSALGSLGLGVMNYGTMKDAYSNQKEALKEQIASSKYARNAHKDFVSGTQNAFGGSPRSTPYYG